MRKCYKQFLLLCVASACLTVAHAQVIRNRQVNASTGGGGSSGDYIFQYTIGEITVSSLQRDALLLTQGFHQPEELPPIPAGAEPVANLLLYPNPVATNLKIQFDLRFNSAVAMLLVNSGGQLVHQETRTYGAGRVVITFPVNAFAAGIYTLILKAGGYMYQEKLVIQ